MHGEYNGRWGRNDLVLAIRTPIIQAIPIYTPAFSIHKSFFNLSYLPDLGFLPVIYIIAFIGVLVLVLVLVLILVLLVVAVLLLLVFSVVGYHCLIVPVLAVEHLQPRQSK